MKQRGKSPTKEDKLENSSALKRKRSEKKFRWGWNRAVDFSQTGAADDIGIQM